MSETVTTTDFPTLKLRHRGKVWDMYEIPCHPDKLLMVSTDRISAYDVVMDDIIPGKGKVLTDLSLFWFGLLGDIIENHLISANIYDYPEACLQYIEELEGRSMLVKKTTPLPIKCIVRGYISGLFWSAYQEADMILSFKNSYKTVLGLEIPAYMLQSEGFREAIFTPSIKAALGEHDGNISIEQVSQFVGEDRAQEIKEVCLKLYKKATDYALSRGIIIADTKFKLGELDGRLILIGEVLTPDSSSFWPGDRHVPGGSQPSLDKQYLRDYLGTLKWNKNSPPPPLPLHIVEKMESYYQAAHRLLLAA